MDPQAPPVERGVENTVPWAVERPAALILSTSTGGGMGYDFSVREAYSRVLRRAPVLPQPRGAPFMRGANVLGFFLEVVGMWAQEAQRQQMMQDLDVIRDADPALYLLMTDLPPA